MEPSFELWHEQATKDGLVDIKFAISENNVSLRQVKESFLGAMHNIANNNCLPAPKHTEINSSRQTLAQVLGSL